MTTRALEAVDEILAGGGDADDVLRAVVQVLASEPDVCWAGILFVEEGALVLGPESGRADTARRRGLPIAYRGERVGELAVDGEADEALLAQIADRVAAHVLLGWDTGGERWEP
ncbi:MAG TPA: hypothetical protein VJ689_05840 [Gaiellaceae bacterium]|nr:hypothetical protein [Gaiellaceae bacterium]